MKSDAMGCSCTTVVLAMSADGKIADVKKTAARFGSPHDRTHLEQQIAASDGIIFGAGTLKAYGTTLPVSQPDLLLQRSQQGRSPQPIQMVASRSARLDPRARFFQQPIPRWLITLPSGATLWKGHPGFDRILTTETDDRQIDWVTIFAQLDESGINRRLILGGGTLVASLLAVGLIDEFWLTVCPLVLGGTDAPTPVDGTGFFAHLAPRLELLSAETIDQEVFLHYRVRKQQVLS